MAADGEEEADGKSSLAPNMTPRSATSAAGGGGLHASASVTDRVQSSVGRITNNSPYINKTVCSMLL